MLPHRLSMPWDKSQGKSEKQFSKTELPQIIYFSNTTKDVKILKNYAVSTSDNSQLIENKVQQIHNIVSNIKQNNRILCSGLFLHYFLASQFSRTYRNFSHFSFIHYYRDYLQCCCLQCVSLQTTYWLATVAYTTTKPHLNSFLYGDLQVDLWTGPRCQSLYATPQPEVARALTPLFPNGSQGFLFRGGIEAGQLA